MMWKFETRNICYYGKRARKLREWHKCFAWRPIKISEALGVQRWVWFEFIERRYSNAYASILEYINKGAPEYRRRKSPNCFSVPLP